MKKRKQNTEGNKQKVFEAFLTIIYSAWSQNYQEKLLNIHGNSKNQGHKYLKKPTLHIKKLDLKIDLYKIGTIIIIIIQSL